MNNLALELTRAANAVAALGGFSAEFASLTDAQVLAARVPIADLLRLTNTAAAMLAGTIAASQTGSRGAMAVSTSSTGELGPRNRTTMRPATPRLVVRL